MYTSKNVISETRKVAASVGLTFKRADTNISGAPAYKFVTRGKFAECVFGPITLATAYDNVCSGYISSWDGQKFMGVNHYK